MPVSGWETVVDGVGQRSTGRPGGVHRRPPQRREIPVNHMRDENHQARLRNLGRDSRVSVLDWTAFVLKALPHSAEISVETHDEFCTMSFLGPLLTMNWFSMTRWLSPCAISTCLRTKSSTPRWNPSSGRPSWTTGDGREEQGRSRQQSHSGSRGALSARKQTAFSFVSL